MTFRARSIPVLALLAFVPVPIARAESASPLARAKATEAELQKDEAKLRLRHNLENLEQLFVVAAEKGPPGEKAEALAGRVRAARLLARWSGRADDAKRAERLAKAQSVEPAPVPAARVQAVSEAPVQKLERLELEVEDSRLVVGLRGVEGDGLELVRQEVLDRQGKRPRIYFDLRPLEAAPAVLSERAVLDHQVKRLRVGRLDERTVRFVFDLEPGAELATVRFEK